MSLKIVLVGASSREFGPATIRDILLSEPLAQESLEIALMDIDAEGLSRTADYAEALALELGRSPRVTTTTRIDEALHGAHFVVTAIEIQRYFYWSQDFHIPRKYGFRQVYGENGGPGGLFHALRNMGPMVEIARGMERFCPEAWLLNYANPLTKLCEALQRLTDVRFVGLCHGVHMGIQQVARFLEHPHEELETRACGINHFTWFQTILDRRSGEDLYPRLREAERRAHWLAEWDEIGLSRLLFRVFGLYPSPGANHIGEYVRWADEMLASSRLQFFYDPAEEDPWKSGEIPTWIYNLDADPTHTPLFPTDRVSTLSPGRESDDADEQLQPSGELAIPIIEGLWCGEASQLDAVNLRNNGAIPGLPDDAIVEVPARVDRTGVHPEQMSPLPDGIVALLQPQTTINRLLVEAFSTKSRQALLQAILLDPCVDSYRNAVEMMNEMLMRQQDVLPDLH